MDAPSLYDLEATRNVGRACVCAYRLLDLYILIFFHHILLLLDPCQDFNERMDRLLIYILKGYS